MNKRQSNIELLRCILMLMIVIIHFLGHNILSSTNPLSINNEHFYSANILLSLCECAVDCFVLISGWFSINFSIRKLIMFLLPIMFYQLIISSIYSNYGGQISVNPFSYWFVAPYIALMIVSPIINTGLKSISRINLAILLVCATLLFVLPITSLSGMYGKNAFIFIYLYCLGYYLKNNIIHHCSKAIYLTGFIISVIIIFVETVFLAKLGYYEGTKTLSYSYDNIFIVLAAVFLLLFFSKIDIQSNVINWISISVFFVYIITENENVYSNDNFSIYKLLNVESWQSSNYFILKILSASVSLFISAIVIDIVRRMAFSRIEKWGSDQIMRLESKILNLGNASTLKNK